MASLPQACYDELKCVVDSVKHFDDDDARVVAACDNIESISAKHNQLYKQVFHPKQVGVHPTHRDGEGFVLDSLYFAGS